MTLTTSRMRVACPHCRHSSIFNIARFGSHQLADIERRLTCSACQHLGGVLSAAPKVVVVEEESDTHELFDRTLESEVQENSPR